MLRLFSLMDIYSNDYGITDFSVTFIDHIYTNKKNLNCKSGILVTAVSDHFGIFSILKNVKNLIQCTTKSNTKRNLSFNDENMKTFKKLLDTILISRKFLIQSVLIRHTMNLLTFKWMLLK